MISELFLYLFTVCTTYIQHTYIHTYYIHVHELDNIKYYYLYYTHNSPPPFWYMYVCVSSSSKKLEQWNVTRLHLCPTGARTYTGAHVMYVPCTGSMYVIVYVCMYVVCTTCHVCAHV